MDHFFYKGGENLIASTKDFDNKIKIVKKELSKLLETRNLSFLIGSGCSLGPNGIPTMKQLADLFFEPANDELERISENLKKLLFQERYEEILKVYDIDFKAEPFRDNLEIFLGTLYSIRFYLIQINDIIELSKIDSVIDHTKNYILYQCLNEDNKDKDETIAQNYKNFYRKLSLRDSNLPKPNVFTTNYDLYSEKSMDELGITYTNGFSGFIERYFNPSIFNYALAEQMDISSFKWSIIDSFIYLFKIHGSVNWIEVEETNKLFNVQELQAVDYNYLSTKKNLMIYPSPIKQNASLGSPYSDLFREFQKRIAQNQSVLITMGYSFGDEHINNLIYQALTIPTFRLVIFSDIKFKSKDGIQSRENIEKLKMLQDPRIWIIGTDDVEQNLAENQLKSEKEESVTNMESNEGKQESIDEPGITTESEEKYFHFFKTITNDLLPDWTENKIELQNAEIIKLLHKEDNQTSQE